METIKIRETYTFGPRKVSKIGNQVAVYLPKDLRKLQGRKVIVTIQVIDN